MRTPLETVGHWARREGDPSGLPWPGDSVDPAWPEVERAQLAEALRGAPVLRRYLGTSPCRLCGEPNGSGEHTDGTHLWPEGLAHYVLAHSVRLPEEFTRTVLAPGYLEQAREGHWEVVRAEVLALRGALQDRK